MMAERPKANNANKVKRKKTGNKIRVFERSSSQQQQQEQEERYDHSSNDSKTAAFAQKQLSKPKTKRDTNDRSFKIKITVILNPSI
jgi:hypothetical protein